jgi:hypothetical protein
MFSSGKWRREDVVRKDVSEEDVPSTFRVEGISERERC